MTITPHYQKRPFSKSKKVKREYINGNHLPTQFNDILCKQPTKSVRHILLPANFSARGLRRLRATRLIHNSFEMKYIHVTIHVTIHVKVSLQPDTFYIMLFMPFILCPFTNHHSNCSTSQTLWAFLT